jgi:hypothetical protein
MGRRLNTYLLTYLLMKLSPSRGAANCAATQNFPAFYGTRRFNTVFTRTIYWSIFCTTSIQSTPSHPISLRSLLILWRNRPMWEVMKYRNLKERDCATVAERCRVLPPFPSLRVLLGYAVVTWSRNSTEGWRDLSDVTRNNTQCCLLHMSDSSITKRDWS